MRGRAGVPPGDEAPARVGRREVRGDRILPEPEPREDVRGHVEGVRRVRGDPGVGAGRREGLGGKLRIVERVDHVVRDAGMLRLERQEAVQDRGRLLLVREARVARRRRAEQRQGVEDPGFVVVRQLLRELPDGIAVGPRAGLVIEAIGVAIEGADRGDVAALPRRSLQSSSAAFLAAAAPAASSCGFGGAQIGWYQVIAMPQYAIAHEGSFAATASNARRASS